MNNNHIAFNLYSECNFVSIPNSVYVRDTEWKNKFTQNINTVFIAPQTVNRITNLSHCFDGYVNYVGPILCGPNVTDMSYTYANCTSLIGLPVCGDNVTNMAYTYANCINLDRDPVCGPNVTDMSYAYSGCSNIHGNMFIYSDNVSNMKNCFSGKYRSNRLDIYVNKNTTSLNTLIKNDSNSIIGSNITWEHSNNSYYNTFYNIKIHSIDNVRDYAKYAKK